MGKALGPEINTAYDELAPRLSPDGQFLYFVRSQHPGNVTGRAGRQDIWVAERQADGSWAPAENPGRPINDERHNGIGAVVDNGQALFLTNTYGGGEIPAGTGISISNRGAEGWEQPITVFDAELIGNNARFTSFYVTPDQRAMVLSLDKGPGKKEDLFVSFPAGGRQWSEPKSLGEVINTSGFETSPFLSADRQRLFFSSNGFGGEGSGDIYMATRLDDTWQNWTEPVNLGKTVNTKGFDGHFMLDEPREQAYFVSGPDATALGDIYTISLEDIPALRKSKVPDTLRVSTTTNVPVPVSFEEFGVSGKELPLCSTRSLDGRGKINMSRSAPHFTYVPGQDFRGTEYLELSVCDPPHSDNCRFVYVSAEVDGDTAVSPLKPIDIVARTQMNVPVQLDLQGTSPSMLDIPLTKPASGGRLRVSEEIANEHLLFIPPIDFVGEELFPLYWHCDTQVKSECIFAYVTVYIEGDGSVVTKVDTPATVRVDTPAVVKVDTPTIATPPPPTDILIHGRITDDQTGKPVEAEISFFEQPSNKSLGTIRSKTADGSYELRLPGGKDYSFEVRQQFYFPVSAVVTTIGSQITDVERNISLSPLPLEAGQTFVLNNIYFEKASTRIRPESKPELQRLYRLLRENPKMEIEIQGHTDSQSSEAFNLQLSTDRAKAVMNYMKYMGIMGTRLRARGLGESQPVSSNETEEGRARNRRVEFQVIKN